MRVINNRIFKYALEVTDQQEIELPVGAEILCVQTQDGNPQMWARVNTDAPKEFRRFAVCGTGDPMMAAQHRYIGTFQMHGGSLVFHVFELTEEKEN